MLFYYRITPVAHDGHIQIIETEEDSQFKKMIDKGKTITLLGPCSTFAEAIGQAQKLQQALLI